MGNVHRDLFRRYECSNEEGGRGAFDEGEADEVADMHAVDEVLKIEVGIQDGTGTMHENDHAGSSDGDHQTPEYRLQVNKFSSGKKSDEDHITVERDACFLDLKRVDR